MSSEVQKLQATVQHLFKELETLKEEKQPNMNDESKNVCRIQVHSQVFDWCQPPNKNNNTSGTGTGFVVKDIRNEDDSTIHILTAHHVIANQIQMRVSFSKISAEDFDATLIGCNAAMDIAILKINNKNIKRQLNGICLGSSDKVKPLEKVIAMGFALGKPHLQQTAGVVSGRISNPSRLQVDVAVNPGNSGGPLLNTRNEVIGIVVSGIQDAKGISYAAPIDETMIMIRRILHGFHDKVVYDYIPSFNTSFTKSNPVLLEKLTETSTGIYCTAVHHQVEYPQDLNSCLQNLEKAHENAHENAHGKIIKECIDAIHTLQTHNSNEITDMTKVKWKSLLHTHFKANDCKKLLNLIKMQTLRAGDIVCSLQVNDSKYVIDLQMNCKFDFLAWPDSLSFTTILDRLAEGDQITFEVFRSVECNDSICPVVRHTPITVPLQKTKNVFRQMYADADDTEIEFACLAGVIFMPLYHNHVQIFKHVQMSNFMNTPTGPHKSCVVITHILPESPFNKSESIGVGDVIVCLNNSTLDSLNSLKRKWTREYTAQKSITLHMRDGSLSTSKYQDMQEANARIQEKYGNDYIF